MTDKIMAKIRSAGLPQESDAVEIAQLLENKALQRMLHGMLILSDELVAQLANADLTTDEGVKTAIQTQARANCYSIMVEEFVDFATITEPKKDKE